jgi:hypothetical protein
MPNRSYSTNQVRQGLGEVGGAREDLSDIIYNIDPTESPILTAAGSTTATGVLHEWLTDTLDTPGSNSVAEGDDSITFTDGAGATRLGNYTQISTKAVRVTGTTEVVDKAGRDSEMAYQSAIKARSLKNDVDYSISAVNLAKNASTGSSPTRVAGPLMSFMTLPADASPGNSVVTNASPAASVGTNDGNNIWGSGSELGVPGTMAQTDIDDAVENAWDNGGKPTLIVAGPTIKTLISTFDGVGNVGADSTMRTDRASRTIYATADVYMSNFGTLNVVPSRHIRSTGAAGTEGYTAAELQDGKVFLIDPEYLKVAYLRPWQQFDLAKSGDSIRRELLVEWTLEVCNPRAHAMILTNAN